ncbi:MAG: hypothetical protein WBK51_13415 [Polaromonas sp.]
MFEYVVLRRSDGGTPISAGIIAEALLFYQKVHLIIDRGTLLQLLQQIGVSQLISLTQRSDFSAVYTEEMLATITNSVGSMKVHDYGAITLSGDSIGGKLNSTSDRLQFELERSGIERGRAKKFTKIFLKNVPVRKLSGDHFLRGGIPNAARIDLLDNAYMDAAIRTALPIVAGGCEQSGALKFEVINTPLGNYVFDNIDFDGINRRRAAMSPQLEPLNVAHLLSHVHDARADIALAAYYGGDFMTSNITSSLVQLRHDVLLQRTRSNSDAKRQFIEIALPDMPTIAEVIDSGDRTFDDYLRLLDKSVRFKHWIKSANPDEGLVREYVLSVSSQDWVQTTQVKSMRYVLTLAMDMVNPMAGIAAGFADNFLVEKLLGGWRPNHFINNQLEPFLGKH